MTISPYDNLPGPKQSTPSGYVEVPVANSQATSGNVRSATADLSDPRQPSSADGYMEVPTPLTATNKPERSLDTPFQAAHPSANHSQPSGMPSATQVPSTPQTSPLANPPIYKQTSFTTRIGETEFPISFEDSLLVSDSLPDVTQILMSSGTVVIDGGTTKTYSPDDQITGTLHLDTIYTSDEDRTQSVKSAVTFKSLDWSKGIAGDQFYIRASLGSLSTQLLNERKFIVKGEIILSISQLQTVKLPVLDKKEDTDLMLLKTPCFLPTLKESLSQSSDISQTLKIKDSQPAPIDIIHSHITVIDGLTQLTSDKLVSNATLDIAITYWGESDGEKVLASHKASVEFTQFIPVKSSGNSARVIPHYDGSALSVTVDSSQGFKIEGVANASYEIYETRLLHQITDAYHKKKEVIFQEDTQPLQHLTKTVDAKLSARHIIDLEEGIESCKPVSLQPGHQQITVTPDGNRLNILGSLPVKLLTRLEDGSISKLDASIPFEGFADAGDMTLDEDAISPTDKERLTNEGFACNSGKYRSNLTITSLWCESLGSRQLEVNLSCVVTVDCYEGSNFTTLTEFASVDNGLPKKSRLAIYVVSRGDTLWTIAKRYATDIDTLCRTNNLAESAPLTIGQKLLISV